MGYSSDEHIDVVSEYSVASTELSWVDSHTDGIVYCSSTLTEKIEFESFNVEDCRDIKQPWCRDEKDEPLQARSLFLRIPFASPSFAKRSPMVQLSVPHSRVTPTELPTYDDRAPSARRAVSAPDTRIQRSSFWPLILPHGCRSQRISTGYSNQDDISGTNMRGAYTAGNWPQPDKSPIIDGLVSLESTHSSHDLKSVRYDGDDSEVSISDSCGSSMNGINTPDSPRHAGFIRTGSLRSSRRGRSLFRGVGASFASCATRKKNRSPHRSRDTSFSCRQLSPSPEPASRRRRNLVERTNLQRSVRQRHLKHP